MPISIVCMKFYLSYCCLDVALYCCWFISQFVLTFERLRGCSGVRCVHRFGQKTTLSMVGGSAGAKL